MCSAERVRTPSSTVETSCSTYLHSFGIIIIIISSINFNIIISFNIIIRLLIIIIIIITIIIIIIAIIIIITIKLDYVASCYTQILISINYKSTPRPLIIV